MIPLLQFYQGNPNAMGTYYSRFEASNSAGSLEQNVVFDVKDYRPWIYGVEVDFPGYAENKIIENFPVYIELDTSISGFSYEQFSSAFGHDLRFLSSDGVRELPYETITWNPQGNLLSGCYWKSWIKTPPFVQSGVIPTTRSNLLTVGTVLSGKNTEPYGTWMEMIPHCFVTRVVVSMPLPIIWTK